MKKIIKAAVLAAIACVTALAMAVCVSAATEDVELSTSLAKPTNGSWGQSIIYSKAQFDCGRITPDSIINIEFETEGELLNSLGYAAELIFQNYSTADPQIWAKVAPYEFTETTASFKYEDIVAMYGSEDLSTVDNLCVGDCGVVLTLTKFTITNCTSDGAAETTTAATTKAAEETTTTVAETEETTTAAETEPAAEKEKSSGGIPIVLIVVITVVVAVAAVVTIIIIKSRKRFY